MRRVLVRFAAAVALTVTTFMLVGGVAFAEDVPTPSGPSTGQSVLDNLPVVSVDAALLAAIVGLAIPLLTALLTKLNASGLLQTICSVVLAALTGLAAWLANVTGVVDLWDALLVAILAGATAGGTRVAWTATLESWLNRKTKDFGIGSNVVKRDEDYVGVPAPVVTDEHGDAPPGFVEG